MIGGLAIGDELWVEVAPPEELATIGPTDEFGGVWPAAGALTPVDRVARCWGMYPLGLWRKWCLWIGRACEWGRRNWAPSATIGPTDEFGGVARGAA
jgi:hypothetical protein